MKVGSWPTAADWKARLEIWRDSRAVIGASDAGAHLDMTMFFNYFTLLFAQAVREQGLLSTEEAAHLITDVPARLYGLRDRGLLVEGSHADIVIFDENSIGSDPAAMRFDLPGGAGRLYAAARGIDHVLVNGAEIVNHGNFTDARPGTLLRCGVDTYTVSMD